MIVNSLSEQVTASLEPLPMTDSGASRANTARVLGGQTFVVLLGNLFTLAVGLPLQILVARTLGANSLGIFGLLDGAVATALVFLNFGIAQTTLRYVPAHLERKEYGNLRLLIASGAVVLTIAGTIAWLVVMAGSGIFARWYPDLFRLRREVACMALMLPLSLLSSYLLQSLRGLHEIKYLVLGTSVVQLCAKGLIFIALLLLGMKLIGYILATVVSTTIVIVWLSVGLWKKVVVLPRLGKSGSATSEWVRYAAVMYGSTLLLGATANMDRFVLGAVWGGTAVGVLVVTRQLQQLPAYFNQMLLMVGGPMFSAAHSRDDGQWRQHIYVLMTDWVVRASFPLLLFLAVFAKPVLGLYGAKFAEIGVWPMRVLLLAQFITVATGPIGNLALMSGLERKTLAVDGFVTLLTAALVFLLIPKFGLLGAAVTALCSSVVVNAWVMVLVRRHLGVRWWDPRFRRWLMPGLATTAVAALVASVPWLPGPMRLGFALVLMYSAFAAASLMEGLNEDDRELFRYLRTKLLSSPRVADQLTS